MSLGCACIFDGKIFSLFLFWKKNLRLGVLIGLWASWVKSCVCFIFLCLVLSVCVAQNRAQSAFKEGISDGPTRPRWKPEFRNPEHCRVCSSSSYVIKNKCRKSSFVSEILDVKEFFRYQAQALWHPRILAMIGGPTLPLCMVTLLVALYLFPHVLSVSLLRRQPLRKQELYLLLF